MSIYSRYRTTLHRHNRRRKPRAAFFVFVALILLVGGSVSVYALVRDLPNPSRLSERTVSESTRIYDRTGEVLLYEIHGDQRRTVIPFEDIPASVKQATLVAEDINFYHHAGIDWRGIARAIITNISRGNFSQGGSTITQQFVKNSILGPEKTIQRKVREQILALLLERQYSKDEIFGFYLNQIPYGSNAYGISAAADMYFAKKPADLTLAEAATIASLPRAPSYYSPYGSHKDDLLKRKDWVLDRMAEADFITREEADKAKTETLSFALPHEAIRAPHFVQHVRDYLNKEYGEDFVERGGLKVITTLDWKLQEEAEKIVREGAEGNARLVKAANAALVSIDPRTGDIISMVGSRDYMAQPIPAGCKPGVSCAFDPYVNIVTRERQPGSAFKPFVYATAFKKGYTPETVLFDVFTEFNTSCNADGSPGPAINDPKNCYHPQDYDGQFRGPVSLRQAIAQSLNVPAVKLLYLVGTKDAITTAQDMGITTLRDPDRYGLSLVLGGAEVTLLDITSAFGVFAADGVRHAPSAILRVETNKGIVLEEKKEEAPIPVLDTEIARVINDVLSDNDARVPMFAPQSSLFFPGRDVAAKTGTTQDYRDAWTIGYTPSVATGVWVGNNDNSPMNQKGLSVMVAGPIWHKYMEAAISSHPPETFTPPEKDISHDKPIFRGQYRSGPTVKIDKISRKLATDATPPELIEEVSFGAASSILALIRKDDPLGDPPANPSSDLQYANWQAGIDRWIGEHGSPLATAPVEYDTLHNQDTAPRISFVNPAPDAVSLPSLSDVAVQVLGSFPLREVSLFVDGVMVAARTAPFVSFNISFPLNTPLHTGTHTLKISAYDAMGNRTNAERMITIE